MNTIQILSLCRLKPHEDTEKQHLNELIDAIQQQKCIRVPILVDKNSFVILDGHHRYQAALKLGLRTIPCILVDYYDEDVVSLQFWKHNVSLTKSQVIEAGVKGWKYPHKTTRHILHIDYTCYPTSLSILM